MQKFVASLFAGAAALPLFLLGGGAHAADSCFLGKAEVMGQLVPQAAETAWLTGDSAVAASKAIAGDFATASAPVAELVGLVNAQGNVFAMGLDKDGCVFVGSNLSLDAFNAALKAGGHSPLAPPPQKPMQA